MQLNVRIKDRIATYLPPEEDYLYVCGNGGDTILFDFDEEWAGIGKKTARFVAGGEYTDVEFSGNTCEIPVFKDTEAFIVGVYAGEPAEQDEDIVATTGAVVDYLISIRGSASKASPETGENYTNEARGYATEAKEAAAVAKEATENLDDYKGMEKVMTLTLNPVVDGEFDYDENGMEIWKDVIIFGDSRLVGNMLLLYANSEYDGFSNPMLEGIIEAFKCRFVEIKVSWAYDSHMTIDKDLYVERLGATKVWNGAIMDFDEMPTHTYAKNVTHLVYSDNYSAPGQGLGPCSYWLNFPDGLIDAIKHASAAAVGFDLVITAYN